LGKYIYTQSTVGGVERIHIHLLIESEASFVLMDGTEANLRVWIQDQKGAVLITIQTQSKKQINLSVRLPDWSPFENIQATFSDTHGDLVIHEGILMFTSSEGSLDGTIRLRIPVEARIIHPHPLDSENFYCIAVARGPFIYCAESVDNPGVNDLRRIRIPQNAQFQERRIGFKGNITLVGLETEVWVISVEDCEGEEDGWVVVNTPSISSTSQSLTLVPFFAWANRGKSDLRTWLPQL